MPGMQVAADVTYCSRLLRGGRPHGVLPSSLLRTRHDGALDVQDDKANQD